jgi:hypothetical protein
MAVKYTDQIFGGSAVLSVATFGNLPVTGATDQRISITGESSLFDTTSYPAIVAWSGSAWELESCAATYLNVGAVEFASGTWTGTGGTVSTKSGARIVDTTYKESWIWNSTSNIFVPSYLGLTTVNFQQKIKGDSTTLESGWTSQVDTACTLVVDGGNKLLATAASASSASRYVKFYCTDTAGTGTANNFYMKCLVQRTNFTMGTTGGINFYLRHDTGNGGRIVEFGDGSNTQGSIDVGGKFMNRASTFNVTYTATANRGDTAWTSETLVQFRVLAGAAAQVKIGTGAWHDIAVSTCRTGPATLRFEMGVASNNSSLNIAACKLRYLQAIRYT